MHESYIVGIVYREIRQPVNNSLAGPSENLNGHLLFLYRLKTTWLQCHDEELIWHQKLTLDQSTLFCDLLLDKFVLFSNSSITLDKREEKQVDFD